MLGAWPHGGPGCGPGRRPSIRNLPSGFLPASQETQGEAPRTSLLCSCLEGKAQRCPHTDHESTEQEKRAGSDGAHFRVKWGRRGRLETSSSEEQGWPSGAPGPWATPPSTLGCGGADQRQTAQRSGAGLLGHLGPGPPHRAPWSDPTSTLGDPTEHPGVWHPQLSLLTSFASVLTPGSNHLGLLGHPGVGGCPSFSP